MLELALTKILESRQCRSCGGKVRVKRICLDCNEPTDTWCEECHNVEEHTHGYHTERDLF